MQATKEIQEENVTQIRAVISSCTHALPFIIPILPRMRAQMQKAGLCSHVDAPPPLAVSQANRANRSGRLCGGGPLRLSAHAARCKDSRWGGEMSRLFKNGGLERDRTALVKYSKKEKSIRGTVKWKSMRLAH